MKIELKVAGLKYDTMTGKFTAGAFGLIEEAGVIIEGSGEGDTMRDAVDVAIKAVIMHPSLHKNKA